MNLFLLIYIPLLFYMFFDFRRAFIVFVFLKIFLNQNLNLINLPGIPLLTIELACNICFGLYYYFIIKKKADEDVFPLKFAFKIVLISIVISTFFSTVGFSAAITRAIQIIFNQYVFVYILWKIINTKSDVRNVLKGLFVVFVILVCYGFFEKVTGVNPLMEYEMSLNNSDNIIDWSYSDSDRLGMGRIQSVIIHPIGLGIIMAGLLYLFAVIYFQYRIIWKISLLRIIAIGFLGVCVIFFTNSRSPIVFMGIAFLPFFNLKKKYSYQMLILIITVFIIGFPYIEPYLGNVFSLFTSEKHDKVGGSSITMRLLQFAAGIFLVKDHFIFGLGIKSINQFIGTGSGILGAESIWLYLLIERGLVGIISHFVLLWSVFKMGLGNCKKNIYFLTLAWFVLTTITSTPGVGFSFFMTIVIIIVKSELISNELK